MSNVEKFTLRELESKIKEGEKYRLFRPFMYNGQTLFNIEKILTEKDMLRLDGKIFGPIEVVSAVEYNSDDKSRNVIIDECVRILKTDRLFHLDDVHHLKFEKRKECEKLFDGIINGNLHLADKITELYNFSKKLFEHSVRVTILSVIIDLGVQEKKKAHNGLRSEEILTGALLHDIAFLTFPESMVEKRRFEYNDSEKALYMTYPTVGKQIVTEMGSSIRSKSIDIVYQHQERLQGNGFPQKLKGNKIEELALIVGFADEFDLMVSKESIDHQKSFSEIMSRFSVYGRIMGQDIIDSFYTWFRYLR